MSLYKQTCVYFFKSHSIIIIGLSSIYSMNNFVYYERGLIWTFQKENQRNFGRTKREDGVRVSRGHGE